MNQPRYLLIVIMIIDNCKYEVVNRINDALQNLIRPTLKANNN